jgi:sirohydrochlorin cobaltochelatase
MIQMKNKKALLVISFGTSIKSAQKSIENIEMFLASKYQEHDLFRAFTSRMIIKKIKKRDGMQTDFPDEALESIRKSGYSEVVCQSLHILNGIEFELTQKLVMEYKPFFEKLTLGRPLLNGLSDYERVADMFAHIAKKHPAILLMGHGTSHHSNSAYSMLEDMLRHKNINNVYVATVEGFPDIGYAIRKMKKDCVKKVTLMPFMIVAGDHAHNDMAGKDDDSWKNILISEGFKVETVLKGLGEYPEIAEMFYDHSKAGGSQEGA